ncbi:hypothetical protein T11_1943 [Trichinella zimbabwensis]|uniref:Secreted protein n=1 Tax=Trichinella zimbabwensis TaxID=268475 RepID=A0A0V1HM43_9BILA|nr:hypothetical protein T11_1943 [Trichinella zimbabwensis]
MLTWLPLQMLLAPVSRSDQSQKQALEPGCVCFSSSLHAQWKNCQHGFAKLSTTVYMRIVRKQAFPLCSSLVSIATVFQ